MYLSVVLYELFAELHWLLLDHVARGDRKALARCLPRSTVERRGGIGIGKGIGLDAFILLCDAAGAFARRPGVSVGGAEWVLRSECVLLQGRDES